MATTQTPIALTGSAVTVVPAIGAILRQYMAIQNYVASPGTMYVAFGKVATAGTAGEWELPAGATIAWGNPPPGVISPSVIFAGVAPPQESVSIINSGGNANGGIMVLQ